MKRYPLLVQLITYFFLILLTLITILGLFYYQSSSRNIRQLIERDTRQSIRQSSQFINAYIKSLKETASALSHHPDLQEFAGGGPETSDQQVLGLMTTVLATNSDLVSAVMVTKDGRMVSTNPQLTMKTSGDMMAEPWYLSAINRQAMPVLTSARQLSSQSSNEWVVSVTQELVDAEGNNLGVLRLDIGYNTIKSSLDQLQLGRSGFAFIVNDNHEFVYHPQKQVYSSNREMVAMKPYLAVKNGYAKDKGCFVYQKVIPDSQWTLVGVASLDQLSRVQNQIFWSFLGTGVLAAMICGFATVFVLRTWIRPIRTLQRVILAIQKGDHNLRAKEAGSPELADLVRQFNTMLDQIDELMISVADKEKAIGQYRLQALASQINPHFLYNTLDTIIWMAEFNDSQRVVDVTKSLAKYFRLALNQGNEWITLANELDHIRQYLFIQKQRYGDTLSYQISSLPAYDTCQIPKLILQPLVENAIYHGIKEVDRKGMIKVSVSETDSHVLLSVWDNGKGMSENLASKSQQLLERGGVGLKNVDQRLKLQYGDAYHMVINSQDNCFSEVILYLPKNELINKSTPANSKQ
ncbi:cache domain-containing sensor histidine kinase [Streptococcus phocae subsp. salmonis]|uniref:cache domain-containing sensor histidine kinase n=1 Tax=Streptococcus phocae TaxID=119224 RepID=UPI000531A02F|nr:sensor histidine kinase [Streptococcus phocae]KGR72281.1 histidine kinase [Streptococcus phocae subsp. salmonis]